MKMFLLSIKYVLVEVKMQSKCFGAVKEVAQKIAPDRTGVCSHSFVFNVPQQMLVSLIGSI